jgi:hypothetical protein
MINLSKIVKNWQDKNKVYQHVKQRENSKNEVKSSLWHSYF